jgi:hypothetical protein
MILANAVGRVLMPASVVAIVLAAIDKRQRRYLLPAALWALPPILFWGLKLGNSARHMMAAIPVLLFVVAVVLVSRIRATVLRVAIVVLLVTLNYVLGPPKGDSISPTSQLHALNSHIQEYVGNLHKGGKAFAVFPVPSKMYVGSPGAPYALHEVMARSRELETYESEETSTPLEIEFAERWPSYVARYDEEVVYVIGITQVTAPYNMPPMEDWFCFSIEPGILTKNNVMKWRPYIFEAVREDPTSVYDWAIAVGFRTEAGLALNDAGRYGEALAMFEKALAKRPDHPDAMWNAAMLYGYFGRRAEALKLLERFASRHPEDPRAEMVPELRQELGGP